MAQFVGQEADETVLKVTHKHWFYMLPIVVALGVVAFGILNIMVLLPIYAKDLVDAIGTSLFTLINVVILGFLALILIVNWFLYLQNKLIVTNENIVLIDQQGIFGRKISRIKLQNIEEITAERRGVLQTLLNFGTLKIETAGEQNNFTVTLIPNAQSLAGYISEQAPNPPKVSTGNN